MARCCTPCRIRGLPSLEIHAPGFPAAESDTPPDPELWNQELEVTLECEEKSDWIKQCAEWRQCGRLLNNAVRIAVQDASLHMPRVYRPAL